MKRFETVKKSKWESRLRDFPTAWKVSIAAPKIWLSLDGSLEPKVDSIIQSIMRVKNLRSLTLDLTVTHSAITAP